jgi:hypothetical protein
MFGAAMAEPGNPTACGNDTPREQNKHCDDDGDGVANSQDQCRDHYDPSNRCFSGADQSQANPADDCSIDTDGDTVVDCEDPDDDNDGSLDGEDNCRTTFNPLQEASDDDNLGDACDSNDDGDRFLDQNDNCPQVHNSRQWDSDGDGVGDACDSDVDGDGYSNDLDNCPSNWNGGTEDDPVGQSDTDHDRKGNACDHEDNIEAIQQAKESFVQEVLENLPQP